MFEQIKSDRQKTKKFVESKKFDMFIMMLIFINSIVLGLMAIPAYAYNFSAILLLIDKFCLSIFIVEMGLKLCAFGKNFFNSRWNTFDLSIVLLSSFSIASPFIIFRAFRLFRLLKYINRFSKMKRIVDVSMALIPNFIAFILIFSVILYVFTIMAVNMFGDRFLDFSTLSESTLTLLQVFSLDGWAHITRSVMKVYPHSWLFFVSFLMLSLMLLLSFILSLVDEIVKKELVIKKELVQEVKKAKKTAQKRTTKR